MTQRLELVLFHGYTQATGAIEYSTASDTGPWTQVALPSPMAVLDALAYWASEVSAAIAPEVLELLWNSDEQRAYVVCSTASLWVKWTPTLQSLLGFVDQVVIDGANGDPYPPAVSDCLVSATLPTEREQVDVAMYRHGRASALAYGRTGDAMIDVVLTAEQWSALSESPLVTGLGAIKITGANTDEYGEADLDGTLLLFPTEPGRITHEDEDEGVSIQLRGCVLDPGESLTAEQSTAWALLWSSTRFGYAINYAFTAEGVSLRARENVPPVESVVESVYTDEAVLVVDRSARIGCVIDERSNVSKAFDLEVRLLDTASVRALFTRPTRFAKLTSDISHTATTIPVDSTAGWSGVTQLNIGTSLETDAVRAASSWTGVTRGDFGRTRSYRKGTLVTDAPWTWRGREVFLDAGLIGPTGVEVPDVSVRVFSGEIVSRPERDGTEWVIKCRDQINRLRQPLGVAASGKAIWNVNDDGLVDVDLNALVALRVETDGSIAQNVMVRPFVAGTSPMRRSEMRQLVADALTAVITSPVLSVVWRNGLVGPTTPDAIYDIYRLYITVDMAGTEQAVWTSAHVGGTAVMARLLMGGVTGPVAAHGNNADEAIATALTAPTTIGSLSLSVVLDEGSVDDLPSAGWVRLEANGVTSYKRYTSATASTVDPSTIDLVLDPTSAPTTEEVAAFTRDDGNATGTAEVSVTFLWRDEGLLYDVLRRAIVSTGDGIAGTYDTLPKGQGLGVRFIDEASFVSVFDGFFKTVRAAIATDAGTTLEEILRGILLLSQRALTNRRAADGSAVNVTAVRVGSADELPVTTITERHLIAKGARSVLPKSLWDTPQAFKVRCRTIAVDDVPVGEGTISSKAPHLIDFTGEAWELDVYGFTRSTLLEAARAWFAAWYRSGENRQTIELHTVPWVDAQPGQVVTAEITDPCTWDYAAGAPGISSDARVLGQQFSLGTGEQYLLIEADGVGSPGPLCPSLAIVAVNGTATDPDSIDVDEAHYDLLVRAKNGEASWKMMAYLPGDDSGRLTYTLGAISLPGGGVCRLEVTVAPSTPTVSLATTHRLTFPVTLSCTDPQAAYVHTDSKVQWS